MENMSYREKIRMWLKEKGWKDRDLALAAGLHSGKIADILNAKYGPTITVMAPIAKAMNVSLDWLADDDAAWPPTPRGGVGGRLLTTAESRVLEMAHDLSENDLNPMDLKSAKFRLMGWDVQNAPEVRTPAAKGDTTPVEAPTPKRRAKS